MITNLLTTPSSGAVTGLPGRRAFDDRYALLGTGGDPLVLTIDVDHFKQVNDRYGYDTGDRVLCEVAETIRGSLRPTDFAARLGGDKFGVLLPGACEYEAIVVAERLRQVVENATNPQVTVSIGVAQCARDLRGGLLNADRALYMAKSSGRNVVHVDRA